MAGPLPRPGRPQRRGQVHPGVHPERHLPGGQRRGALRRAARPGARRHRSLAPPDRHRIPALDGGAGADRGGERVPRPPATAGRPGGLARDARAGRAGHGGMGLRHRCPAALRRPDRGAAADRGDRPRTGGRHPVPAARRADRGAGARRDRAAVRPGPAARRERGRGPVHLAPSRGSLRDLPGRRGAQGRRAGVDQPGPPAHQGRPGHCHGAGPDTGAGPGTGAQRRDAEHHRDRRRDRKQHRRPAPGPAGGPETERRRTGPGAPA